MLVSAIIPSFNRADMVGNAIGSVLAQTYRDIEIIIVDDGSTDNTEEVVRALQEDAAMPVRYYRKRNEGCAAARNEGLRHARGDCVAFLDSDDRWLPTAAESLVGALERSGADFVYSPAVKVYEDGKERLICPVAEGRPELLAVEHFMSTNLFSGAVLYRRRVFDGMEGFDETLKYNEDSDFRQRVAVRFKGAYSPSPTVKVWYHRGSKSGDRVAIYLALIRSSEKILEQFPEFKASLGRRADQRLNQLRVKLVEALLLSGEISRAAAAAGEIEGKAGLPVRVSLLVRSGLPLRIAIMIRRVLGICRKLFISSDRNGG